MSTGRGGLLISALPGGRWVEFAHKIPLFSLSGWWLDSYRGTMSRGSRFCMPLGRLKHIEAARLFLFLHSVEARFPIGNAGKVGHTERPIIECKFYVLFSLAQASKTRRSIFERS
jgi:hypothetical protein